MANPVMVASVQETPKSLSIIDNVNLQQVQATMQKIAQFQAVVQKTLKKDHDYGIIPGTGNKPTLLKPGAEKILMLMGLTSEYELIEKVQDYDTGFFAFTVKCTIWKDGIKITEGMGHANTREKRYTSGKQQDAFTLANTVLKMAKKRAQVDAVLTVASLSEIFTQDLEDYEEILQQPPRPTQTQTRPQTQQRKIEQSQQVGGNGQKINWTAFWTKVRRELNLSEDEIYKLAAEFAGLDKVDTLTAVIKNQGDLDRFIAYIEEMAPVGEFFNVDINDQSAAEAGA